MASFQFLSPHLKFFQLVKVLKDDSNLMLLKLYGEMNRNFVLVLDSYLVTLDFKFTQTSREKGGGGVA